jgi:hypothetical protein
MHKDRSRATGKSKSTRGGLVESEPEPLRVRILAKGSFMWLVIGRVCILVQMEIPVSTL